MLSLFQVPADIDTESQLFQTSVEVDLIAFQSALVFLELNKEDVLALPHVHIVRCTVERWRLELEPNKPIACGESLGVLLNVFL